MGKTKGTTAPKAKAKAKAAPKPVAKPAPKPVAKPAPKPVAKAKPTAKPKSPRSTPVKPSATAVVAPASPPPPRDEMIAPRDVARLLRYGERFGPHRIDVRWLPLQLPVTSGTLALFDPAAPKSVRVLDRPAGSGQFRVMLSLSRDEAGRERLAAIVVHGGRPPIARWTVAHYKGGKRPASPEALPRVAVTSGWLAIVDASGPLGALAVPAASDDSAVAATPIEVTLPDGRRALALACGNGEYAAYWAIDATDKPVCLVVDFDPFTQKEWKARPPAA